MAFGIFTLPRYLATIHLDFKEYLLNGPGLKTDFRGQGPVFSKSPITLKEKPCYRTCLPDFEDIWKVNESSINIPSIDF